MRTKKKVLIKPTRESYQKELENIGKMIFPLKAIFIGEEITVLGPIHRFELYKRIGEDNSQLMCEQVDGKRFITFASYLKVEGKPLATPPKIKGKSSFEKVMEKQNKGAEK